EPLACEVRAAVVLRERVTVLLLFFFQAEDGIRDRNVTGVQTCALPISREIDGKVHEPQERMTIDVPEDYLGAVTQLMAQRKGRMETMSNHGSGWVRMEFVVPARGLIGFRTRFLTETRGTGIAYSIAEGRSAA